VYLDARQLDPRPLLLTGPAMPDLPLMTLTVLTAAFAIEVAWLIYA
jgi:hypothetical protein